MVYDDFPVYSDVKELVLEGARVGGDKKEFVFEDDDGNVCERTFSQVHDDEMRLGSYLRSVGVTPPMKIGILCENCYFWNVIYYTAAAGGYVSVPLDTRLTGGEIAGQLADCSCDVLFYSDILEDKVQIIRSSDNCAVKLFIALGELQSILDRGEALREQYEEEYLGCDVSPEDLLSIVYTSGTTGKTKGVMLSHKNVMADCNSSNRANTGGHAIGFLPLNHTYSWVTGLFSGLIRTEWGFICTKLSHIYQDIQNYKPYQFAAVPLVVEFIYNGILREAKRKGTYDKLMAGIEISNNFLLSGYDARNDLFSEIHESLGGNLKYIFCGGAYLDPVIEKFFNDIGIPVLTGYGLTECSPVVATSRLHGGRRRGSLGLPLDCNEVIIHDPDENGIGEIYIRGDNVMMGYYGDPEATAEAFDGDWLKSGDYGYFDKDGYLYFTGRKKNLIILSNGKNVSPEDIENVLNRIDIIKEVIVYAEKDKITAECYLDEDTYPDARERLQGEIERVNKDLADYKRVSSIKIRDTEFPKTTSLKIIRNYAKT